MEILEIIKIRRSIRKFQKKEIPKEIVDKLIEALIWAPSAGNLQSRKFYFIFNENIKKKLAALGQSFIAQVPLVIVGCTNKEIEMRYGERGKKLYSICDVSASVQNMMLVSSQEKLGTCWIGAFDEEMVTKILDLPKNLRPIVIVPIGYPAESPSAPPKVSKKEAIQFIK